MSFLKKHKIIFLFILLGGIAGYAYYYFIGCASGTCAITSKPLNSTMYGMLMGGLLGDMLFSKKGKKIKNSDEE